MRVTGVVLGITLVVFALMFKTDRNWIPNPNLNYLSWSYGMATVSVFFTGFASIGLFTLIGILRQEMREPPRADPMAPVSAVPQWGTGTSIMNQSYQMKGSKENLSKPKEKGSQENLSRSAEKIDLITLGDSEA